MKSATTVRNIADPMKRVTEAATLVREAEAKVEQARALRDMATVVAHLDQGVPPVRLYRDVLNVSRGLFNRMIQRAPSERPEIENAERVAAKAAKDVRKYKVIVEDAREIRDVTALMLMSGEDEAGNPAAPVSNADIARATKLTTARVAQMRGGGR
jgi:hypothetical protein